MWWIIAALLIVSLCEDWIVPLMVLWVLWMIYG